MAFLDYTGLDYLWQKIITTFATITSVENLKVLPTVTNSDNGKILQVSDGSWTLTTPITVYTGTSTPSSTLGNNGDLYLQTA